MWKGVVTALVLIALLAGCQPKEEQDRAKFFDAKEQAAPVVAASHVIDVGDIESSVTIEAFPAKDSCGPNVTVDNEKSIKGKITQSTVSVKPPYPAAFPIEIRITPREPIPASERPVILRGNILRDNQPIQPINLVLGASSPNKVFPIRISCDAVQGMEPPLKSVLLFVQVETFFLPETTDLATLDIATVKADETHRGAITSNPVRINFVENAP